MLEAGLAQGNLTPDLAANLSGRNTRRCGRDYAAGKLPCRASLSWANWILWGKLARIREQAEWQAAFGVLTACAIPR